MTAFTSFFFFKDLIPFDHHFRFIFEYLGIDLSATSYPIENLLELNQDECLIVRKRQSSSFPEREIIHHFFDLQGLCLMVEILLF